MVLRDIKPYPNPPQPFLVNPWHRTLCKMKPALRPNDEPGYLKVYEERGARSKPEEKIFYCMINVHNPMRNFLNSSI